MNNVTKSNIINFLNWNDKHANIDNSYSNHELLAMFIYELNYNVLDCYNWVDLLEYSQGELLEQLDDSTKKAYELLNGEDCTVDTFQKIVNEFVK